MAPEQHYLDLSDLLQAETHRGLRSHQLARLHGVSASQVRHHIRVARNLGAEARKLCRRNASLSFGHARVLAGLELDEQEEVARRALAGRWSVRRLELSVRKPDQPVAQTEYFERLSERMSEVFGHPISVRTAADSSGGSIRIQYANSDDFEAVCSRMGLVEIFEF